MVEGLKAGAWRRRQFDDAFRAMSLMRIVASKTCSIESIKMIRGLPRYILASIEQGGILTVVELATIDGFAVTATITNNSLNQLGLKKGMLITADVKAPWVILQKMEQESLLCIAENRFKGVVTHVNQGRVNTEYVVRLSEVTELCSVVTSASVRQVGLKKDDQVWAMFNSFAVVLHTE